MKPSLQHLLCLIFFTAFVLSCREIADINSNRLAYDIVIDDFDSDESGDTASFSVKLNRAPMGELNFSITSQDTSEATVQPARLKFNNENWSIPQKVTLTGTADRQIDGDIPYAVVIELVSKTSELDVISPSQTLNFINRDRDSARIDFAWSDAADAYTDENGREITFTLTPSRIPTQNIRVNIYSGNEREADIVSAKTLTFTNAAPQTVRLRGKDDQFGEKDGDIQVQLHFQVSSLDPQYALTRIDSVNFINRDNDSADLIFTTPTANLLEENGDSKTYAIRLASNPTGPVEVTLIAPTELEFPANTNKRTQTFRFSRTSSTSAPADQSFTLRAIDNQVVNPSPRLVNFGIIIDSSKAPEYGITPSPFRVIYADNDSAQIRTTMSSHTTFESGAPTADMQVSLSANPQNTVRVQVGSSDVTEGKVRCRSGAPLATSCILAFDTTNWSSPQTVAIQGIDDTLKDGNVNYSIILDASVAIATNPFHGLRHTEHMSTIDDDRPSVVTRIVGSPSEPDAVTSVFFRLPFAPVSSVRVPLRLATSEAHFRTGGTPACASTQACTLTFTTTNWNVEQEVRLLSQDDNNADGDQLFTLFIEALSGGGGYDGYNHEPDLLFQNLDDERKRIVLRPIRAISSEDSSATQARVNVGLSYAPAGVVNVELRLSDLGEGVFADGSYPRVVSFDALNAIAGIDVDINGVNDVLSDGAQEYQLIANVQKSSLTDQSYARVSQESISLLNLDDETVKNLIWNTTDRITGEDGDSAKVSVYLSARPDAAVSITARLTGTDAASITAAGGTRGQTSLSFSTTDWATPKVIEITGNTSPRGNHDYQLVLNARSTDAVYNSLPEVSITLNSLQP